MLLYVKHGTTYLEPALSVWVFQKWKEKGKVNQALNKARIQISVQLSSWVGMGATFRCAIADTSADFFGITQGSELFHLGAFAQDGISSCNACLLTLTPGTLT